MKRIAFAAIALSCLSGIAFAQNQPAPPVGPDFSKVEVKTTDLGHNTYMLEGFGGNVAIAVGDDGIIMVDSQFAPMHDKLKAATAAISPLPVKFLIVTHHHGDHAGGIAAFTADGVTVVAHDNMRKRLASGTTHNLSGVTTPPAAPSAMPGKTYDGDATTIEVKGRVARLAHPHNAHTDGDTYVYFADANVLSTGDTFGYPRYPNSDFLNGGSIKGMIAANENYLTFINDNTKVVPGHGPLAGKAQVTEFRDMLVTARDRMQKLIAEGKNEQQVYELKPFADLDAKWAVNDQAARNFMRVVYMSLKQ
jgi:glyoxylase-like metal-dependent hydrolase (beta-lactamase superfamily II)